MRRPKRGRAERLRSPFTFRSLLSFSSPSEFTFLLFPPRFFKEGCACLDDPVFRFVLSFSFFPVWWFATLVSLGPDRTFGRPFRVPPPPPFPRELVFSAPPLSVTPSF